MRRAPAHLTDSAAGVTKSCVNRAFHHAVMTRSDQVDVYQQWLNTKLQQKSTMFQVEPAQPLACEKSTIGPSHVMTVTRRTIQGTIGMSDPSLNRLGRCQNHHPVYHLGNPIKATSHAHEDPACGLRLRRLLPGQHGVCPAPVG